MIWWWKEGLKRREGGRKSMSQHNLSLKGDRRKTCVWADNERFSAFQREIKRCIIIAVGIIWRIFPHILKETFSNGLDYHCKVFKVMFTYLILKRDNPVLLGLHVVPALAECRVEIINIWCLDFIRVAQGESCRVSPRPKVTKGDQRHQSLWSHWRILSPVELQTGDLNWCFRWPSKQFRHVPNGVIPSSPLLLKHWLFPFQWWWSQCNKHQVLQNKVLAL